MEPNIFPKLSVSNDAGIWLVYQLNIWPPEGKKCEENILRRNNWDSIKGCDGSKWPRGTFCVNILLHFCIWALLRGLFSTVEINCWQDSSHLGISGSKPNIAKSSYLLPIPPTALAYQRKHKRHHANCKIYHAKYQILHLKNQVQ